MLANPSDGGAVHGGGADQRPHSADRQAPSTRAEHPMPLGPYGMSPAGFDLANSSACMW